jgi:hypothetical protein
MKLKAQIITFGTGGFFAFLVSGFLRGGLDVKYFCICVLFAPSVAIFSNYLFALPDKIKKKVKEEIKEEMREQGKECHDDET